jgi:XFP N-terminal domain
LCSSIYSWKDKSQSVSASFSPSDSSKKRVASALASSYGRTLIVRRIISVSIKSGVIAIRSFQQLAYWWYFIFKRPRWPMIVLRSAKGWTSPREVDGHYLEGFWRAHQLPIPDIATNPAHLKLLETWMRGY